MTWEELVEYLNDEINWDEPNAQEFQKVERALSELARTPDQVAERVYGITHDRKLFREYMPHMECPRPCMDKFILHMDPDDRFRIRLHRFKPQIQNRGAQPTIHSHRWAYSTVVLNGGYTEYLYNVEAEDMNTMTAKLVVTEKHDLRKGDTNSLMPQLPHRTVNESDSETCATLFVRGKSLYKTNTVYDPETYKFRVLHGMNDQLKLEMENIADLITA